MSYENEEYDYYEPDGELTVAFEGEDGEGFDCKVMFYFTMDDQDFIALMPLSGEYEGEVYPYFYTEYEDGSYEIDDIEDDEIYDLACERIDEILDDQEFEAMGEGSEK